MTKPTPPIKKWYQRRRFRAIVVILLLGYFCLIPSRYKITPETTGIDNPIVRNGQVDYFAEYERLYIEKLSPPEENGLRDMIAACGPAILEQRAIAETVPWEQISTHENSKEWFEKRWLPLCEHLYIDPYKRPMFYDSRGFYHTMRKIKEARKQEADAENFVDDDPDNTQLWEKLTAAPWKAEDHPEVARWLEERSPPLDYFGVSVRKPNYVCWRQDLSVVYPEPYLSVPRLITLLLPDVQAQREFTRDLAVRVTERIGRDDFEGAWYDVMSMLHVARHLRKDLFLVTNLASTAIMETGIKSAKQVLNSFPMTEERLGFMARTFDELKPFSLGLNTDGEKMMAQDALQTIIHGNFRTTALVADLSGHETAIGKAIVGGLFPIDMNIAGKRLLELQNRVHFEKWADNPALTNRKIREFDALHEELEQKLSKISTWWRVPLIRTRSQMMAEWVFVTVTPLLSRVNNTFNRATAQQIMLQIALELERYQLANGDYPENLDALVPGYLDMIPLDPHTARATFVYKRTPDSDHPYQLYSFGPNGKDDGGISQSELSDAKEDYWKYDIVF